MPKPHTIPAVLLIAILLVFAACAHTVPASTPADEGPPLSSSASTGVASPPGSTPEVQLCHEELGRMPIAGVTSPPQPRTAVATAEEVARALRLLRRAQACRAVTPEPAIDVESFGNVLYALRSTYASWYASQAGEWWAYSLTGDLDARWRMPTADELAEGYAEAEQHSVELERVKSTTASQEQIAEGLGFGQPPHVFMRTDVALGLARKSFLDGASRAGDDAAAARLADALEFEARYFQQRPAAATDFADEAVELAREGETGRVLKVRDRFEAVSRFIAGIAMASDLVDVSVIRRIGVAYSHYVAAFAPVTSNVTFASRLRRGDKLTTQVTPLEVLEGIRFDGFNLRAFFTFAEAEMAWLRVFAAGVSHPTGEADDVAAARRQDQLVELDRDLRSAQAQLRRASGATESPDERAAATIAIINSAKILLSGDVFARMDAEADAARARQQYATRVLAQVALEVLDGAVLSGGQDGCVVSTARPMPLRKRANMPGTALAYERILEALRLFWHQNGSDGARQASRTSLLDDRETTACHLTRFGSAENLAALGLPLRSHADLMTLKAMGAARLPEIEIRKIAAAAVSHATYEATAACAGVLASPCTMAELVRRIGTASSPEDAVAVKRTASGYCQIAIAASLMRRALEDQLVPSQRPLVEVLEVSARGPARDVGERFANEIEACSGAKGKDDSDQR